MLHAKTMLCSAQQNLWFQCPSSHQIVKSRQNNTLHGILGLWHKKSCTDLYLELNTFTVSTQSMLVSDMQNQNRQWTCSKTCLQDTLVCSAARKQLQAESKHKSSACQSWQAHCRKCFCTTFGCRCGSGSGCFCWHHCNNTTVKQCRCYLKMSRSKTASLSYEAMHYHGYVDCDLQPVSVIVLTMLMFSLWHSRM